jgi:hypothetical protein
MSQCVICGDNSSYESSIFLVALKFWTCVIILICWRHKHRVNCLRKLCLKIEQKHRFFRFQFWHFVSLKKTLWSQTSYVLQKSASKRCQRMPGKHIVPSHCSKTEISRLSTSHERNSKYCTGWFLLIKVISSLMWKIFSWIEIELLSTECWSQISLCNEYYVGCWISYF